MNTERGNAGTNEVWQAYRSRRGSRNNQKPSHTKRTAAKHWMKASS